MRNTLFILLKKTFIVPVLLIVAVSGLVASLFTKIAGILGGFIWLFLGIFVVIGCATISQVVSNIIETRQLIGFVYSFVDELSYLLVIFVACTCIILMQI